MFCSTSTTDTPCAKSPRTRAIICSAIAGESPSEGSSSNNSEGFRSSAIARLTMRCSPPLMEPAS